MIRIALAQVNVVVGDLAGNCRKIAEYIECARQLSVDIIAFPELAITGYPPEDLLSKKHFIDENLKAMRSLVRKTANITAVVGFVDAGRGGHLYNAAAVLHNRQLRGIYRKAALPNYGVFDEKRYFSAGKTPLIFTRGKTTFGVTICEDLWVDDGPYRAQAQHGARILINVSASPYHAGKVRERERLLRRRAREAGAFLCYANLVGGQDELVFDGGSSFYSPSGELIASGRQFQEDLAVCDINTGASGGRSLRRTAAVKRITLTKQHQMPGRLPIQGQVRQRMHPIEEVYHALVLGTRDYLRKNGFTRAVIGLSGGIDSALTAAIACDAVGNENVIGVTMPSRFTSPATKSDALMIAKNLGIRCIEMPIHSLHNEYRRTLRTLFAGRTADIAEENLQARIRGTLLMALSNKFGWLVLTAGNKSEIAVGYCTLYGDMAGGFAVLKDVLKTTVYELAHFYNIQAGRPVIPRSVFTRAPTAELRKNQKDQDSLPAYGILDPILEAYIEGDKNLLQMCPKKSARRLAADVITMVDRSEYKRRQAPPGVKITPRAFGKDRRFPITNRYRHC